MYHFLLTPFLNRTNWMTADTGAERWTVCERLDGSFAPFCVPPHEQIEEIFIRQIAGFAYLIVDGKISQFCRHFETCCRQNEAFCRHVFAPIKSDGKKGQFCRHIFEKCRQKQANLPSRFMEMSGEAANHLAICTIEQTRHCCFRIFPDRTKRQVYKELGLTYNGRVLGRSILGRSILGRSSGQGRSIPLWPPHVDLELW